LRWGHGWFENNHEQFRSVADNNPFLQQFASSFDPVVEIIEKIGRSLLLRNQQVAGSNPIAGSSIFKGFRVLPLRPFFRLVGKLGQIRAVLLAKSRQF